MRTLEHSLFCVLCTVCDFLVLLLCALGKDCEVPLAIAARVLDGRGREEGGKLNVSWSGRVRSPRRQEQRQHVLTSCAPYAPTLSAMLSLLGRLGSLMRWWCGVRTLKGGSELELNLPLNCTHRPPKLSNRTPSYTTAPPIRSNLTRPYLSSRFAPFALASCLPEPGTSSRPLPAALRLVASHTSLTYHTHTGARSQNVIRSDLRAAERRASR